PPEGSPSETASRRWSSPTSPGSSRPAPSPRSGRAPSRSGYAVLAARDALHPVVVEPAAVREDRELVPFERRIREDVGDDVRAEVRHGHTLSAPSGRMKAMRSQRLETFADGIFAIAATLLILSVDSQVGNRPGGLGDRLLHIWPSYLGYAVSFLMIGIIWVNHHTVMDQIARTDRTYLFLSVGF